MPPNIRIAIVQLHPKEADPEFNFRNAESHIRSAAGQGCDLAVLPEYHLTSWCPAQPAFLSSCASSGAYLEKYRALAAELHISIIPGTLIEPQPDGRLFNMEYFIDPSGAILASYQKKNLWHPERPHLAFGPEPHVAFDTPLGGGCKVGMLICWDLAFPEAFRALVAQGAKLIVVPAFWLAADGGSESRALNHQSETLFLDSVITARAFENTACVVFVNAGGPPASLAGSNAEAEQYAGRSQVALPICGALGILGAEEAMNVVEVDLNILEIAERAYKIRADLAGPGWHYAAAGGVGGKS